MKDITRKSIAEDMEVIRNLFHKYSEAVYENQEGQEDHFDNQPKQIRLAIGDLRCGLMIANYALDMINQINDHLIEPES
jgi:hypothetical protein